MKEASPRTITLAKVRTLAFIVVMIPLLVLVALVGILSLVFLAPVVIYAGSIRGKPLKQKQRNPDTSFR
jgi:hypothetical protein